MATPADQRLLDLLDKWLNSLELHIKYSSLDEDSYSRIQPWPQHQRPSRWIIDLAKQKALALRAQVEERIKAGDAKFSDSLELMTFLANLVGAEHIERFIPLAHADSEQSIAAAQPQGPPSDSATGTREMPKFTGGKQRATGASGSEQVARVERNALAAKAAAPKPASKPPSTRLVPARPAPARPAPAKAPPAKPAPTKPAPAKPAPARQAESREQPASADTARDQVIADAVRLVQWGRKWYELAEVIARMADRPSLTDVRRILKDNKADIDKKAGRA